MSKALINYKKLRKISAEAARTAIIDYLTSNGGNITNCAKAFGIQRLTIYDILKKNQEENLKDRSKAPKKVINKTSDQLVSQIMEIQKQTDFVPSRLVKHLLEHHNIKIAYGTLRGILRRNRSKS